MKLVLLLLLEFLVLKVKSLFHKMKKELKEILIPENKAKKKNKLI